MSARNILRAGCVLLLIAAVVGLLLLIGKLPTEKRHYSAFAMAIPAYTALLPIYIAAWRKRRETCSRNKNNG